MAFLAGDRSDGDDPAVSLFPHIGHNRPVAVEHAMHVDLENLLPGIDGVVPGRGVRTGYACAADEDIDPPETVDGARRGSLDVRRCGELKRDRVYISAELFAILHQQSVVAVPNWDP